MCSVEEFQTESYEISEKSENQTSGRTMFIQNVSGKERKNALKTLKCTRYKACRKTCRKHVTTRVKNVC